jgi:hypothetical protein
MNPRYPISSWLLVSAGALLLGALLVRYGLATPAPATDSFMQNRYPVPRDALNLAGKWFLAALLLGIAGGYLTWRARRLKNNPGNTPTPGFNRPASRVWAMGFLAGFWLALVTAVELSGTAWTTVLYAESKDAITPSMRSDPHIIVFEEPGDTSVRLMRIIPRNRKTAAFTILAHTSTHRREAADAAREGMRTESARRNSAIVAWILAAGFAGVFGWTVLRTDGKGATNPPEPTSGES